MIDTIFRFFTEHISAYGAVLIVSMIPLIELRGSVIVGTAFGLPWLNVLALSIVGNLIPIPFILIFGEKLMPTRPTAVRMIENNETSGVPNFLITAPATNDAPPVQTPTIVL